MLENIELVYHRWAAATYMEAATHVGWWILAYRALQGAGLLPYRRPPVHALQSPGLPACRRDAL